jgi:hypothetical protein
MDESFSQDLDGNFGKNSIMFCDIMDILEGDIVITGGVEYKVVGIKIFANTNGRNDHMEIIIREQNEDSN